MHANRASFLKGSSLPVPVLRIDGRSVEVPPGATVLAAARQLGIDIPTLCHLEGYEPSTSCLVCMVKVRGQEKLAPACATAATDGMEIDSETPEVHAVRRTALELLLSDHVGDCLAPCHFACPAHMDVPTMLREITAESVREALATVKETIALPATLGRVCPKPCEKGCRRSGADGAVAVCGLKRFVADADLASGSPYLPECRPPTGRRVAIVGAGPTGLSAAYYLRRFGHAVTLLESRAQPGGRLRDASPDELPRATLDAEIATILALGIEFRGETTVEAAAFDELRRSYDAVLVCCGSKDRPAAWGLKCGPHGVTVERDSFVASLPGVFAAGNAIRHRGLVVRSVADGHEAALAIDQFLSGQKVVGRPKPFSVRMGKLDETEMALMVATAGQCERREPAADVSPEQAAEQAARCLHCDCRSLENCKLRHYAAVYGADAHRFHAPRKPAERIEHRHVIFEPGKCIACGLCIQIAARAGEPLGLTFVGRGFDVRIGVPFNRSLDEALTKAARACVEACPTAALALQTQLPILMSVPPA